MNQVTTRNLLLLNLQHTIYSTSTLQSPSNNPYEIPPPQIFSHNPRITARLSSSPRSWLQLQHSDLRLRVPRAFRLLSPRVSRAVTALSRHVVSSPAQQVPASPLLGLPVAGRCLHYRPSGRARTQASAHRAEKFQRENALVSVRLGPQPPRDTNLRSNAKKNKPTFRDAVAALLQEEQVRGS